MKKNNILYVLLIIIIAGVFGYTIYKHFNEENNENIPYNIYNDIIEVDDGYVVVGSNDYKYVEGELLVQGQFIKYDKDLKIVKKTNYNEENKGIFLTKIIKTNDGYIATGSILSELPIKSIMIKLDNDLNIVKKEYLSELNTTVALQIVKENDNYLILCRTLDRVQNDEFTNEHNIIYKIDSDLNIIEKHSYKEEYIFDNIYILDNSYLLTGNNGIQVIIAEISKENYEIISSDKVGKEFYYVDDNYFYNNKLYNKDEVYDLETKEIINFDKNNLFDNNILLVDNDIIYASHFERNSDESQSLYLYDLNMNKIKEYKTKIEYIRKIIIYDDKILILGSNTGNDNGVEPILKYIEK